MHEKVCILLVSGWMGGFFELQILPVMSFAAILVKKMRGVRHIGGDVD
jgi:hypothetical protein